VRTTPGERDRTQHESEAEATPWAEEFQALEHELKETQARLASLRLRFARDFDTAAATRGRNPQPGSAARQTQAL
jgi:hypothetical protein